MNPCRTPRWVVAPPIQRSRIRPVKESLHMAARPRTFEPLAFHSYLLDRECARQHVRHDQHPRSQRRRSQPAVHTHRKLAKSSAQALSWILTVARSQLPKHRSADSAQLESEPVRRDRCPLWRRLRGARHSIVLRACRFHSTQLRRAQGRAASLIAQRSPFRRTH